MPSSGTREAADGRLGQGARRAEVSSYCLPSPNDSGGVTKLGLTKFEAKIGQENEPSIRMFQKLHFKQVRASIGEA